MSRAITLCIVLIIMTSGIVATDAVQETRATPPADAWEGVIENAIRPIVVAVDFGSRTAKLDVAGSASLPIDNLSKKAGHILFQVTVGARALHFDGERRDTEIRGVVRIGERSFSFWLERLPDLPAPRNRVEAWRQDIDAVLTRFLRYDRSFGEAQREAARARLQKLRTAVDRLSDAAITVELARAVALSGNAHTRLYLMRNRTEVRRVPLRVWWFRDELRIVRAAAEHAALLGCRVTAIGQHDAANVFHRAQDIKPGNASWQRYMSAYFLTSPDILFGAGVIPSPELLPLTVRCGDEFRRVEVSPLPLRRSATPVEAWRDLAPGYPHSEAGFRSALPAEKAPLYLRHPERNYWVEYLPESAIIYAQYNRAQAMTAEPMADFIRRVARLLDQHPVQGLIVDVRFNTGGDAGVGTPLVETLAARLKGVLPVVVLTGRATFSAGITHASQWKQLAQAKIFGEPIGDHLDFWAEGGNLVLPNSGLTVHYANAFHGYSQRNYPQFQPYFADLNIDTLATDVNVEETWADYAVGRDPVFDAAVAHIRKGK
jgi:hypothetical protein